jgi:hypothetical protein
MGKKLLFLLVCGLVFISCKAQPIEVKSDDTRLEYMGRITKLNYAAVLSWPGSSVAINFEGADISVKLKDEKGENYYYAIVDDGEPIRLKPTTEPKSYPLATHLRKGHHNALLYKLTESRTGKTWFYGFELDKDATILPPQKRDKKIEFYGNSITVGYSVDDTVADANKPEFTNNYFSYAAITARNYKASYTCIAKSGIGFMISWFDLIMPDMYDRAQEDDADTKWDFTQYTPNIVVVDLGQNDSWLIYKRDFAQFKKRFGAYPPDEKYIINAYSEFIKTIRGKYPNATIICTLGSMDATKYGSPWPGYIEKAVASIRDRKILTHFFPYNNTDKHPKRQEQMLMAKDLINFIDFHAKW